MSFFKQMEIQLLIWVQKDLRILTENEAMKLYIENTLWTFCKQQADLFLI